MTLNTESDFYERVSSEPGLRDTIVKFVGGSAAVTKVYGRGITVTYVSTGIVNLVWNVNPGIFIGLAGAPNFQATTASAVKGFTCVPGVFNTSTKTLALNITNAAESLTDLAALQWLTLVCMFIPQSL